MAQGQDTNHSDFEIQFYEELLKKKPDFIEALSALGDLYTREGLYEKGMEIDQRLSHLRPQDPIVLYNLACSYSLLDDRDNALKTIKQAIAYGYDDFYHLEQDSDLDNLRHDSRFKEYLLKVKGKKAKQP
jgi:tetratricopeptide (TPR) repeat protein